MKIPNDYRPFLIQKLTNGAELRNSTEWNLLIKSMPFKPIGDVKAPFTRNWPDQNGNDVFIPDQQVFEAYDIECDFVYYGDKDTASQMVNTFIYAYLASGGLFMLYDTYTHIGKTNVNYKSISPDKYYNEQENVVIFKMTFTVNDPVTMVVPNTAGNSLIKSTL